MRLLCLDARHSAVGFTAECDSRSPWVLNYASISDARSKSSQLIEALEPKAGMEACSTCEQLRFLPMTWRKQFTHQARGLHEGVPRCSEPGRRSG